jgi:hypothetical protein
MGPPEGDYWMATDRIRWPGGTRFGFTIIDDTDFASVRSAKPVYDFLSDCGLRTTKTVWPLGPGGGWVIGGQTLENMEYRAWIMALRARGFEIALHGVSDGMSSRNRVVHGLDSFRELIGADPSVHTNHFSQREGMYWGAGRFDGPMRWLYQTYRRSKKKRLRYEGESPASDHFWGDVCQRRIKYVRNFVFEDINTLKMDPLMPYHDARRPYVRHWFSSSNGNDPEAFCRLISEANQDRLEEEGGACLVYTHLGVAFHRLPSEFRRLMIRLSRKAGWFVPATPLLEHIGNERGWPEAGDDRSDLTRMQWRWAWERTVNRFRKHFLPAPDLQTASPPAYVVRAKGVAGHGG